MLKINACEYSDKAKFDILGVSYIGKPVANTAMFVTKKVGNLIYNLENVAQCLVFAENGLEVPEEIQNNNCFAFSENPQLEYAHFSERLFKIEEQENSKVTYKETVKGVYIADTAVIGENSYIEHGVKVGPNVVIGKNARIYSGVVINNAIIGDDVIINENAVIGANGFTMAADNNGNKLRMYSLGKVVIGNNVEIGSLNNISRGSGGNTVLEDNVKLDSLIHVGHDVHLHKNVEVTAGVIFGGFVEVMESAYVGIGSVIRNRITINENSFVGMGSIVTKSVESGVTVVGNPAKPFDRK